MDRAVGLDVHKDSIAAAALDHAGRVVGEASFENTHDGHQLLHEWIVSHPGSHRVGLEPSGGVGNAAASRLVAEGLEVLLVSPRLSSRQARRGQRGKTDPIDAIAIARVMLQEVKLPPFQPDGYERDLKLLVDYRDQIHQGTYPYGESRSRRPRDCLPRLSAHHRPSADVEACPQLGSDAHRW